VIEPGPGPGLGLGPDSPETEPDEDFRPARGLHGFIVVIEGTAWVWRDQRVALLGGNHNLLPAKAKSRHIEPEADAEPGPK
jgi:hypothetical protein